MSKEIINEITNTFHDTFTTAIYFFNFGFIPLIWLGLIVLLGCIFYFFAIILSPLKNNISFINNIINNISLYFADKLRFESIRHLENFSFFGLSISVFCIFAVVSYFLQFQFKYAEHIVFLTSYQKKSNP